MTSECSALNRTFIIPNISLKEYNRKRSQKSMRAERWGKGLWNAILRAWHNHIVMISLQLHCLYKTLTRLGQFHKSIINWRGPSEPYPSQLNYWLLMNSGAGTVIVFSFVTNGEPTTLQWKISNPWSYTWLWLNSQKKRDMNMGKGLVWEEN